MKKSNFSTADNLFQSSKLWKRFHRTLILLLFSLWGIQGAFSQTTLHVDAANGSDANNGTSWATAYATLSHALNVAGNNTNVESILVAAGTYYPTGQQSGTHRDSAFAILRGGLKLLGGYPAGGGTRDPQANIVYLDGNINNASDSLDNSYHIMVIAGLPANADSVIVDGFTFRNGNANGSGDKTYNGVNMGRNFAGGLIVINNANGAKNIVRNCVFTNNSAVLGGGMVSYGSDTRIEHCVFHSNTVSTSGAGGGLYNEGGAPLVSNCLFSGNTSGGTGAGMHNVATNIVILNSTFSSNTATLSGGAVRNVNCPSVQIVNCIEWGNGSGISSVSTTSTVTYSTLHTLIPGVGNLNIDPAFVNTSNPIGADGIWGTADDGLRLQRNSSALNSGDTVGISHLLPATDLSGDARIFGGIIDRGAYEVIYSNRLHVDDANGSDANNGYTWATAHKTLAHALNIANGISDIDSILVAEGTYYPTGQQNGTDRDSAFAILRGGIKIYGGFQAGGVGGWAARTLPSFGGSGGGSYLDGNIGNTVNGTDNSYHVLVIAGLAANADSVVVEGFTIRNAHGNGTNFKTYNGQNVYRNWGAIVTLENALGAKLQLRNCEVSDNFCTYRGAGMLNWSSSLHINRCIFKNNTSNDDGAGIYSFTASPVIVNSLFTNNTGLNGGGIYVANSANTQIINNTFTNNTATNAGGAVYVSNAASTQIKNCIAWNNSSSIGVTGTAPTVTYCTIQGGFAGTGNSSSDPLFFGTGDYRLATGSPAINAGNPATSLAEVGAFDLAGNGRILDNIIDMGAYEGTVLPYNVLHVDSLNGNDNNLGDTWATALATFSRAINIAGNFANVDSILVAKGTYFPTGQQNGTVRDSAFTIFRGGFKLLGGYPAGGGARNPQANPVYLDGDIGTVADTADNSYHIMVIAGLNIAADSVIVDGFTFRNAHGHGIAIGSKTYNGVEISHGYGGGIAIINNANEGKIVVRDCIFTNNTKSLGGGIFDRSDNGVPSSVIVTRCTFLGNRANGGGMYNSYGSWATVSDCLFSGNTTPVDGRGGGISNYNTNTPTNIINCVFEGNTADLTGGGIHNTGTHILNIINCVFEGNTATRYKGGGFNNVSHEASVLLLNTTFTGNTAPSGGGGAIHGDFLFPIQVVNSVIYGNSSSIGGTLGNPAVSYSIIQGGYAGTGNIDADPLFVNAANPIGADGIWGTADDGLKLQLNSPAINTGDTVGISHVLPALDFAGDDRIIGGIIDMGAYESPFCPPTNSTDVVTACGSHTWIDGIAYTASNNTATHTIVGGGVYGCDSIVTLNLTINNPTNSTDVVSACGSYTWIDGNTYSTNNNTATHTIVGGNTNGCDSIVTLNLTIGSFASGTDVVSACGSYTWIDGIAYTASNNIATHTIVNGSVNSCDSIVTLNLTINNPTNGTDVVSACGSYTWIDGNTYTADNNTATYTIVGGNVNSCDSIVTLNLTVNNLTNGTHVVTACGSYTWIDGNTYTANNNTATYTIVNGNANGCDSIVTLNLTINNITNGTDVVTACENYTWIDGIAYTTSNNTATYTIVGGSANSCDSIVTLNLTIYDAEQTTQHVQICTGQSYLFDGQQLDTDGIYTAVFPTVHNCDSTVTLHLAVVTQITETINASVCTGDSYAFDGQQLTVADTYTATYLSSGGCDSVVTLHLAVNQPTTATDIITACDSYTWIDGNTYTASNNAATYTIAGGSANSCDSIVTLNLTINTSTSGTDTVSVCENHTWIDGNTYNTNNNTATHTIVGGNANGCDSIVTLNLTVRPLPQPTIIQVGDSLETQKFISYQWLLNDSPIDDTDESKYIVTENGSYSVIVTDIYGCSDTSAAVYITVSGIATLAENVGVMLYPNPNTGKFLVEFTNETPFEITVTDIIGKEVVTKTQVIKSHQFHLPETAAGVYFLNIVHKGEMKTLRFSVVR